MSTVSCILYENTQPLAQKLKSRAASENLALHVRESTSYTACGAPLAGAEIRLGDK